MGIMNLESHQSHVQDYAEDAEEVNVEQKDFESALASLTPSLSFDELARYQTLRSKYQSL